MTELETLRFIEVKFYYLIHCLFKLNPNVDDLLSLIDLLSMYNPYNKLTLQNITLKVLDQAQYEPNKTETIVLYYKGGYPVRDICKLLKISNNYFYKILYGYNADPFNIVIKETEPRINEMEKFITAYKNLCTSGGIV